MIRQSIAMFRSSLILLTLLAGCESGPTPREKQDAVLRDPSSFHSDLGKPSTGDNMLHGPSDGDLGHDFHSLFLGP